jgi:hypothetical protein
MRSLVDVGRTDTYLCRSGNPEAILRPDFPSGRLPNPGKFYRTSLTMSALSNRF